MRYPAIYVFLNPLQSVYRLLEKFKIFTAFYHLSELRSREDLIKGIIENLDYNMFVPVPKSYECCVTPFQRWSSPNRVVKSTHFKLQGPSINDSPPTQCVLNLLSSAHQAIRHSTSRCPNTQLSQRQCLDAASPPDPIVRPLSRGV